METENGAQDAAFKSILKQQFLKTMVLIYKIKKKNGLKMVQGGSTLTGLKSGNNYFD